MSTVVPGLIKIGKTKTSQFEHRMYNLEHNGYSNVTGLKRKFAIKVEDYDEKEILLDTIFSKSNVPGTKLFALNINTAIQLLSSFDGTVVYPKSQTREAIFKKAAEQNPQTQSESQHKKKRFRFSMVGLHSGDVLNFTEDSSITVTVADDIHVKYQEETWSMSALAQKQLCLSHPVQGTMYFEYNGKSLVQMRSEAERQKDM